MTSHKILGLVSGGKDSCFNLLHCAANGHEVVALATLTPEVGTDELDSHLYQSVGTTVPPLIAQSMGIPHYSIVIRGRAVEQGPEYGDRSKGGQGSGVDGDETEDLYNLLVDVKKDHPDLTAVSTGAILSTYQRLRIEHVCGRLGLVSLAYLWQADQMPLLELMKRCGMDVVLVKVAGVGLGREMVGTSLWDQLPALRKLERIYGSHPAGEGGEYETLNLDSPLFSHSVNLLDTEVIVSDPEPNLVAYLRIPRAELVAKPGWVRPSRMELREMLGLDEQSGVEGILDEQGREVLDGIARTNKRKRSTPPTELEKDLAELDLAQPGLSDEITFARRGRWFAISTSQSSSSDSDIGTQMYQAFSRIQAHLSSQSLCLPLHAAHITLLLPSMSLFPGANASYTRFFGTSPPSRATVAVPLPPGVGLRIEVVGYDDLPSKSAPTLPGDQEEAGGLTRAPLGKIGGRTALHVQSLSYWAPANIGPYSQAITVDSRVQIAGQIPLIPSTLTLPTSPEADLSPYPAQCALALQHVRRVVAVLKSPMSTGGGWTGWVESVTAWWAHPAGVEGDGGGEGAEVVRRGWSSWAEQNGCEDTPFLVVRAKELPRGALVEFQVNLHTGRRSNDDPPVSVERSDAHVDDDDDEELEAVYQQGEGQSGMRWESCRSSGSKARGSRAIIFLDEASATEGQDLPEAELQIMRRAVSARVYHLHSMSASKVWESIHHLLPSTSDGGGGVGQVLIPVFEIHDRLGGTPTVALEVFGV